MKKTTHRIEGKPLTITEQALHYQLAEGYAPGGDYADGRIRIDPRSPARTRRATLIHEVQHAFADRSGLREELRRRFGVKEGTRLEEFIIEELTLWWMVASDDAPDLIREMFDL